MSRKISLESYQYFALIANIVTVIIIFIYIISLSGLRFRRTRAFSVNDFSVETNDFVTLKYYFIYPIPLFFITLVSLMLFIRLCFVYFITMYLEKESVLENMQRTMFIIRVIHIIITIFTSILLLVGVILLSIDLSNCNAIGSNGASSLCTNELYCCASDVLTPPGIAFGCPWIQSCNGVTTPFVAKSLGNDLYFTLSFSFNIILLIFMIPHTYFGFYSDDLNYVRLTKKNEEPMLMRPITNGFLRV